MEKIERRARDTWTGSKLDLVLKVVNYFAREYTGVRSADGGDYASGRITDVKDMSWYSDPSHRSNGVGESKNKMTNRVTHRTVAKGGIITGAKFIEAQKHLEYLVKSEIAEIEMVLAGNPEKERDYTQSTQKLKKVIENFGEITDENMDAYLSEIRQHLANF